MRFGEHLRTGVWGLADKALPLVYGLGFVVLVIRVLPEADFGNFVLLQELFLVITALATAIALQPMLKFASEDGGTARGVISAAMLLHIAFLVVGGTLLLLLRAPVGELFKSDMLADLLLYLPALLAASLLRNVALVLLQAEFRFREVFIVDALHFLGAPVLVWVYSRLHLFDSAVDLVMITIISLSLSSAAGLFFARLRLTAVALPSSADIRRVWDYGVYSLGGNLSYLVTTRADTFFLSAFSGPVAVAVYNAAKVFARVFDMIPQVVQMFVLPVTSRLSSRGEMNQLQSLAEKAVSFTTIATIPAMLIFLFAPTLLCDILYDGRYYEAVPVLRIFALLGLVVPLYAVGSSILMGLGDAKTAFQLGIQMLILSLLGYLVLIPLFGAPGAAAAYAMATAVVAVTTTLRLRRHVLLTPRNIMRRERDVRNFFRDTLKRVRDRME